ncbi:MAG: LCP family protein, partial [Clostridia bacterium]|nr:LCP family protein [Clostridia bacterium]
MKHRRVKKKTKFSLKKRLAVFGISLAVLVIAFVSVMWFGGLFMTYEEVAEESENITEVDKETGKINILVVGLDNDGTRTDTILIATYDMDNDAVNILSIPRDTRMYVGGRYQKINCAYAIKKDGKMKGVDGTIEAVSRLTAIPINYYVEFTFEAFREMIDALGGVDYDVPQNMNYDDPVQNLHIHLTKGYQHLDGDKAEQLVRFRKYPLGDIDRVKVQQNFIKELAKQKLNASVISKMPDIFKVLQKHIKTNFKPTDVTKYAFNVMDLSSENIHAYSLPGTADSESYGASFWVPDMEETKKLIEETFGYDASKATIHSADGKSIAKDVKIVKKEEEPIEETVTDTQ